MPTTNQYIRPEDGWVQVASNPAFAVISGFPHKHPYYIASGTSAPSLAGTPFIYTLTFAGSPTTGQTISVNGVLYTALTAIAASEPNPNSFALDSTGVNLQAVIAGRPAIAAVKATGTVTFSGLPSAIENQTVDIGDETYTFVVARTEPFQVSVGATAALTAANLNAAVNSDSGIVTTTVSGAVVTVSAVIPDFKGNSINLKTDATNVAVSGTTLTGGKDTVPPSTPAPGIQTSSVATNVITITSLEGPNEAITFVNGLTNVTLATTQTGAAAVTGILTCHCFKVNPYTPMSENLYVRVASPVPDSGYQGRLRIDALVINTP